MNENKTISENVQPGLVEVPCPKFEAEETVPAAEAECSEQAAATEPTFSFHRFC